MNVHIVGKGAVELQSNDYVTEGGEGKIYVKGGKVYKIYHQDAKMIPEGKIKELSVLNRDSILKPEDILLDAKNKPVGYCMRHIKDTYHLPGFFTKTFRQRHNLSPKDIIKLVCKLQDTISYIHKQKILLVDINELNFLVGKKFDDVYCIDVDSYQTPSYPATAIMDTVWDRHAPKNTFTELTDWFSFALLSFNLLIGIHPYKGKHHDYITLDERMQNNISVFNSTVKTPAVCYPLDTIPPTYRNWYYDLFEKGERRAPPTAVDMTTVKVIVAPVKSTEKLVIKELFHANGVINFYCERAGCRVVLTEDYLHIRSQLIGWRNGGVVIFTPKANVPVIAYTLASNSDSVNLYDAQRLTAIPFQCIAKDVMAYDNRLYIHAGSVILEMDFFEGMLLKPVGKPVANVMEQATTLYEGVAVQNLFGSCWVNVFPQSGASVQIHLKEFDGMRVIDAKYHRGVMMVVTHSGSKYNRHVLRFDKEHANYDIRTIKDVTYSGINFVVLDNGICASITEEETLELFDRRRNDPRMTRVEDSQIDSGMKLYHNGAQVLFAKHDKLYHLTMK